MNVAMYVPEDVPFDERLFESNTLLKQYWENSVTGRSNMAQWSTQRSAEEEDLRNETLKLYDDLVATSTPAVEAPTTVVPENASQDLVVEVVSAPVIVEPAEPLELGPVLKPLAASAPVWAWVVIGVLAGLLLFGIAFNFRRISGSVGGLMRRNPIPNVIRMRGGQQPIAAGKYDF